MDRLFFECAVRAALLVAGTALVLYALPVRPAAARHRVWTSVVLLILLLLVWTPWGPKVSLRVLPPVAPAFANGTSPPAATLSTSAVPSPPVATGLLLLLLLRVDLRSLDPPK